MIYPEKEEVSLPRRGKLEEDVDPTASIGIIQTFTHGDSSEFYRTRVKSGGDYLRVEDVYEGFHIDILILDQDQWLFWNDPPLYLRKAERRLQEERYILFASYLLGCDLVTSCFRRK